MECPPCSDEHVFIRLYTNSAGKKDVGMDIGLPWWVFLFLSFFILLTSTLPSLHHHSLCRNDFSHLYTLYHSVYVQYSTIMMYGLAPRV